MIYAIEIPSQISSDVLALIPAQWARKHGIFPIKYCHREKEITILKKNGLQEEIKAAIAFHLPYRIRWQAISGNVIERLIETYYSNSGKKLESATQRDPFSEKSHQVVEMVEFFLKKAVEARASDLHFESMQEGLKVRMRIDGALIEELVEKKMEKGIIARIKVLANLDIMEMRRPQDGRFQRVLNGKKMDFRVSTLPTFHGESVVLRVLDKTPFVSESSSVVIPSKIRNELASIANSNSGLFLVTGPTGSGKTTTLYVTLRTINSPNLKINTIEDPVEYELDGIVQSEVNPAIDFTFASILRSVLRHDPDKIMIGEIRDAETAKIAVQAALTGHLVMSTLHTNDAPSTIIRLMDLGIEAYKIASTLKAVLSQRLLRQLCPECKQIYTPHPQLLINNPCNSTTSLCKATGCNKCNHTGYNGRKVIFELIKMNPHIQSLISKRAPLHELKDYLKSTQHQTLFDVARQFLAQGIISYDDLIKNIPLS
ncbi:MAG: hypothetical protein A2007_03810 [Verrucomicrobia bacterium GWC2_42_7]|nr:MAG: hypothetical protein A2007_03810 [Verrucomicrobia bacterium GWC2_42_7]